MNIYIVRHGETNYNKQNLFQGLTNIPLNSNGKKQAEELAEDIKSININYIYSSPLKRAIQTANIINKYFSKDIIISYNFLKSPFSTARHPTCCHARLIVAVP